MSRPVEFVEVARRIAEFGDRAMLITVGDDDRPHVVTAVVASAGDRLVTRVGSRTATNLAARPGLTLTWPALPGGEYVLILDGSADVDGDGGIGEVTEITIRVERGILHRLAGLEDPGPSCVEL